MEVELLRPGTIPPESKIVAHDVGTLYAEIDASYLGCGLQWEQDGEVFFMVLEFTQLDSRHTREYLALKLHECLEKYGLSKKLCILSMDGAGNCNTTATNLVPLNPHFKQATRKKRTVKVAVSATQVEEVVLDGTPPNQEDADLAHLLDEDAAERKSLRNQLPDGAARNEHDTAVVSKIRIAAIQVTASQGVTINSSESKSGLELIPRVCVLARKLHDSAPVVSSFAKLVHADKMIVSQTQMLARRCTSRWNSDYDSLDTALILEQPVRKLLKEKDLNLKAFKLTDAQWNLAADLCDVLEGANNSEISNICCVAAYGGGLVLNKYIDLVPNCEAYEFSIVLAPNLKLDWFKKHGRSMTQICRIREIIVACYDEIFKTTAQSAQTPTPAPEVVPWDLELPAPSQIPNNINSYLDTPPLASLNGKTVLQYWAAGRAAQPDLA
ncbi:hypothetical protein DFH07DRAFT_1036669 [Mycena maculata]|uniref:Uncharacterized protein n=1 Tax=Mycena maculata TaxID=230809 RepID=A0AAD7IS33_9AGAR|nr:hypothetical protein DFH07DRAFT_1036669 [Mycena maculata]